MSARPTFINIGPGRCASSWLLEVLQSHPEIAMARIKETEFFNTHYARGFGWYESLFPVADGVTCRGEISNCYYTEPEVPQRIWNYDRGMKLIVNLRNPFSLLRSFHEFGIRRGLELGNINDDLQVPIGRIMGSGFEQRRKTGTLNRGDLVSLLDSVLLAKQLAPFFDTFPRQRIFLFIYERLQSERSQLMRELYEFLGVDSSHDPQVADTIVNAAMTPKSRLLARTATRFAFQLRQVGAHRLLDQLKKSRFIKRCLFSDSREPNRPPTRDVLVDEVRSLMEQDMRKMIELHPALAKWWGPLLQQDISTGGTCVD